MKYQDKAILFPVLRLGNYEKMQEALEHIEQIYEQAQKIKVYESTLERNKDDRIQRARRLSGLLRRYEERLFHVKQLFHHSIDGMIIVRDKQDRLFVKERCDNGIILDLHKEYEAVIDMYQNQKVTVPLRAFFGEMVSKPLRRKAYPIVLADQRVNLDQLLAINNAMKYPVAYIQGPPGTGKASDVSFLCAPASQGALHTCAAGQTTFWHAESGHPYSFLAINNAMKYPVAYIQGPPGTGKTSTIINTIVTAFFNEKTVLRSCKSRRSSYLRSRPDNLLAR